MIYIKKMTFNCVNIHIYYVFLLFLRASFERIKESSIKISSEIYLARKNKVLDTV